MIMPLLVDKEIFARIACMDGRAFGAITACDPCDYSLNPCMRRHLDKALPANQQKTEATLGYDLTPRYHSEELLWDGYSRLQLSYPGVARLNVAPQTTKLAGTFAISPFLLEDVVVETISGYRVVTLDKALVDNPNLVTLRNVDSGGALTPEIGVPYPKRDVNGNWQVAIEEDVEAVNVQHCRYMTLTLPQFGCEGTLYAVRTGTLDAVIPFAKPPTTTDGETTFWFYAWSLIDPAFADDEEINLLAGEFYKLMSDVEFICVKDVAAPPLVFVDGQWCYPTSTILTASISLQITTDTSVPGTILYTLVATNLSEVNADSVVVSNALPVGVTLDSYRLTRGSFNSGTGVWTLGALDRGAVAVLTLLTSAVGDHPNLATAVATGSLTIVELTGATISAELLFDDVVVLESNWVIRSPIKVKLFYRTDPALLDVPLGDIEEAIVYLTAAEMPVDACGCTYLNRGFIHEARKHYIDINVDSATGDIYAPVKYGDTQGQLVYRERLIKAKRKYKLVKL